MKKYILEAIGTFFLTMVVVLAAQHPESAAWKAACLGAVWTGFYFVARPISGAHFNPAISVARLMDGSINRLELPYYVLAQSVGAVIAAIAGYFMLSCQGITDLRGLNGIDLWCGLPAEFLGGFAFAFVFIKLQTTEQAFIGGVVLAGLTLALESVSGAVFNPATGLAFCISGTLAWGKLWLYILGPVLGAAAATSVHFWLEGQSDTTNLPQRRDF